MARPPRRAANGEEVPPKECHCYKFPHKEGPDILVCYREDYWGALSQDQQKDPQVCVNHDKLDKTAKGATMDMIKHYQRFLKAVERAAKSFEGENIEDWRRAVGHEYKNPPDIPPRKLVRERQTKAGRLHKERRTDERRSRK
jgi:hypothetical protein